jgi:hypothetical protein
MSVDFGRRWNHGDIYGRCLFPGNIPRCCGMKMGLKFLLRMGIWCFGAQDVVLGRGDNFMLIENPVISVSYE